MKRVSELTPEEFQKTFPITLEEYSADYERWYEEEKERILEAAGEDNVVRMNHIGSSAVPGLLSKPIVDMLLEVDGTCRIGELLERLKAIGYGEEVLTRREEPLRLLAVKGMSCEGFAEKCFFLHVRYHGDWDELYFRDYLIAHPDTVNEYGELKQKILRDIEDGVVERMPAGRPSGYSAAKLAFVQRVSLEARKEFPGKYRPGSGK